MKKIKLYSKSSVYLLMLLVLCSFTFFSPKNKLSNQTFRVNGIAFEKIERDSYELSFLEGFSNPYGNFIDFTDSTFHSYYRASCGNDCFTEVKGTYNFLTDSTIQFFVISITKSGMCSSVDENYRKGDFGTYSITNNNNTITLNKKL